jgi:hypothetical protein
MRQSISKRLVSRRSSGTPASPTRASAQKARASNGGCRKGLGGRPDISRRRQLLVALVTHLTLREQEVRTRSRRGVRISSAAALFFALAASAHAATLYVANDGIDPPGCVPPVCIVGKPCRCGAKASPCRSITCGIMSAAAGDTIVVGPGAYGDLNHDGTLGDLPGEENPDAFSPGCGCVLALNKPSASSRATAQQRRSSTASRSTSARTCSLSPGSPGAANSGSQEKGSQ